MHFLEQGLKGVQLFELANSNVIATWFFELIIQALRIARGDVRMLKSNPNLREVYLCLDHDGAGIEGCYRLASSIHSLGAYSVWRIMPKNKDWDEDLKKLHGRTPLPPKDHLKATIWRNG